MFTITGTIILFVTNQPAANHTKLIVCFLVIHHTTGTYSFIREFICLFFIATPTFHRCLMERKGRPLQLSSPGWVSRIWSFCNCLPWCCNFLISRLWRVYYWWHLTWCWFLERLGVWKCWMIKLSESDSVYRPMLMRLFKLVDFSLNLPTRWGYRNWKCISFKLLSPRIFIRPCSRTLKVIDLCSGSCKLVS